MKTLLTSILLLAATALWAQKPVEMPLWPQGAPNSNGLTGTEEDLDGGRVANVVNPSITVYPVKNPNGIAIIACPGGGYARLAMNHEGHDMAGWMGAQGITYVVLKYRMPNGHREVPLSDAEQAIRLVRQHAKEWGVDPECWARLPEGTLPPRSARCTARTKRGPTSRCCSTPSSPWSRG